MPMWLLYCLLPIAPYHALNLNPSSSSENFDRINTANGKQHQWAGATASETDASKRKLLQESTRTNQSTAIVHQLLLNTPRDVSPNAKLKAEIHANSTFNAKLKAETHANSTFNAKMKAEAHANSTLGALCISTFGCRNVPNIYQDACCMLCAGTPNQWKNASGTNQWFASCMMQHRGGGWAGWVPKTTTTTTTTTTTPAKVVHYRGMYRCKEASRMTKHGEVCGLTPQGCPDGVSDYLTKGVRCCKGRNGNLQLATSGKGRSHCRSVCGGSDPGAQHPTHKLVDYVESTRICEYYGERLCRKDDYYDTCCGTGCQYDHVWNYLSDVYTGPYT